MYRFQHQPVRWSEGHAFGQFCPAEPFVTMKTLGLVDAPDEAVSQVEHAPRVARDELAHYFGTAFVEELDLLAQSVASSV